MLADTFRTHKQKNAVGLLGPDFEAELCNTHNPRNVASSALLAGHRGVEHIFESLEPVPGATVTFEVRAVADPQKAPRLDSTEPRLDTNEKQKTEEKAGAEGGKEKAEPTEEKPRTEDAKEKPLEKTAETDSQGEPHLDGHLDRMPAAETAARAVLNQMKLHEARHAAQAWSAGAQELPAPAKALMRLAARVMTTVAHRI